MKVTVLGTGIMGAGVARSLIRAGHTVTVWNRTRARAEPLADDNAHVASSAAEAVQGSDAVILTLFDGDAVLAVMEEAVDHARDAVWIQASTIGLAGTARVAALATDRGVALLEAMMLGTKGPLSRARSRSSSQVTRGSMCGWLRCSTRSRRRSSGSARPSVRRRR